ncbi:MAG: molybdenum ABC transporter ATP-binding protein [Thermodesulfobacteriota bacterium]
MEKSKNEHMLYLNIKKQLKTGENVDLSLDIQSDVPDGITVIFGPSGAGKTTLLRTIGGLITPDEGTIKLGETLYFDSVRRVDMPIQDRKIGFVFQNYALFPHLTAEQNISYGIKSAHNNDKKRISHELLKMFKIEYSAARYPSELSGGEQQRIALARALATEPRILLLDEPLSSVDLPTRSLLLDEIVSVQKKLCIPFIYVTHNQAEAVRIGSYMFLLHGGQFIQQGKPIDLFNSPDNVLSAHAVGSENIFIGYISEHKAEQGITIVTIDSCKLEIAYNSLQVGSYVTIGVSSLDIIVTRDRIVRTSARNILKGSIKYIIQDTGETELIVDCGVDFKVSITTETVKTMELNIGEIVYLLIKARACHVLL